MSEILTADEVEAIRQAGRLYSHLADKVVGRGPTRESDLAEIRDAIHKIQHAVMSQAAGRLWPDEYRLLGETLTGSTYGIRPHLPRTPEEEDRTARELAERYARENPVNTSSVLPEGLCGNKDDHEPHDVVTGSLAPYRCHADQSKRLPYAAERRRSAAWPKDKNGVPLPVPPRGESGVSKSSRGR